MVRPAMNSALFLGLSAEMTQHRIGMSTKHLPNNLFNDARHVHVALKRRFKFGARPLRALEAYLQTPLLHAVRLTTLNMRLFTMEHLYIVGCSCQS